MKVGSGPFRQIARKWTRKARTVPKRCLLARIWADRGTRRQSSLRHSRAASAQNIRHFWDFGIFEQVGHLEHLGMS